MIFHVLSVLFQQRIRYRRFLVVLGAVGLLLLGDNKALAYQTGQDWSKPIDITQPSNRDWHLFGTVLCDKYQNTHLFWVDSTPDGAAIYYRNDANGEWSSPIDVIAVPYPNIVGLREAIDPKRDVVHLFWVDQWLGGQLFHAQAPLAQAGNPRAWSTPTVMPDVTGGNTFQIDSKGVMHFVYSVADGSGMANTLYYMRSDDGQNWSMPVEIVTLSSPLPSSLALSMALDEAGRIHIAVGNRSLEYGKFSEAGYLKSSDGGKTWGPYKVIETGGTTFQGVAVPAVFAFGKDEVHLTWADPRRLHQWSYDGGDTWSNPIEIMDLGAAFGGNNQLVKDAAGGLYVVSAEANGVYVAQWDGVKWGTPQRVEDRDIDPHGQNMTVCQGNQLHVAYYDRTGDETVWYSSRQIDAPPIARRPIPAPEVVAPAVLPSTAVTVTEAGTSQLGITAPGVGTEPPAPEASPVLVVFMFIAPALIVVGCVVGLHLLRIRYAA